MAEQEKRKTRLQAFTNDPFMSMWRLAVPIMISIGIQTLYTLIDMIYIGRLGGDAIACLLYTSPSPRD